MVEAISDVDVEPRIARDLQLSEPLLPGLAGLLERTDDLVGRHLLLELPIHAELHGAAREAAQLIVGTEDLRFHAGHHARDGLVGDLGEGLLAKPEEREVGAIAEQQELEVVMPHPEVPFQGLLVRVEQVVIGGHAPPGVNVGERLELRQLGLRQRLRIPDELHHFLAPLRVEPLPVCVVVERALLELLRAAGDLGRIGHGIAADVHAAVDDAVIDPQRRGQAVDACVRGAEGAVRSLGGHHVERGHGLREVHGVVEPEALVILLAKLDVVGIGRLRALRARQHLQRAG